MKKPLLVVAIALALTGCSTFTKKDFTEIEKTDGQVGKVPTWFIEPQKDEGKVIYGAGTGLSDDLQFSMDKAMHEAKVVLGDKISSKASSTVSRFVTDDSAGSQSGTIQRTEKVSSTGFTGINVSSYDVVNRAIFKELNMYRAYVLLKLDTSRVKQDAPRPVTQSQNDRASAAMAQSRETIQVTPLAPQGQQ